MKIVLYVNYKLNIKFYFVITKKVLIFVMLKKIKILLTNKERNKNYGIVYRFFERSME